MATHTCNTIERRIILRIQACVYKRIHAMKIQYVYIVDVYIETYNAIASNIHRAAMWWQSEDASETQQA